MESCYLLIIAVLGSPVIMLKEEEGPLTFTKDFFSQNICANAGEVLTFDVGKKAYVQYLPAHPKDPSGYPVLIRNGKLLNTEIGLYEDKVRYENGKLTVKLNGRHLLIFLVYAKPWTVMSKRFIITTRLLGRPENCFITEAARKFDIERSKPEYWQVN